jgi:hypothetical protein
MSLRRYVGPTFQDLVQLGAKYGPCVRRYDRAYAHAIPANNGTVGCCLSSTALGPQCFSTEEAKCTAAVGRQWFPTACGGPACCENADDYPNCRQLSLGSLNTTTLAVCTCSIVARPCCVGVLPTCAIKTESECTFLRGHFHRTAALCSDVDCIESVCGLSKFSQSGQPDQWYRLLVAPFLPAGMLHLFLLLIAESCFALRLERVRASSCRASSA